MDYFDKKTEKSTKWKMWVLWSKELAVYLMEKRGKIAHASDLAEHIPTAVKFGANSVAFAITKENFGFDKESTDSGLGGRVCMD